MKTSFAPAEPAANPYRGRTPSHQRAAALRRLLAQARNLATGLVVTLPIVALSSAVMAQNPPAGADRAAERARRQLQLQQQQLQELQQKASQAQAEKDKAEQARGALQQQLKSRDAAAARAASAQRALAEELKAAQAAQTQQQARIAELEAALQEQRRAAEQAIAVLATRERDLRQLRAALQESGAQRESCQQRTTTLDRTLAECSSKNDRLFKLGGELITRYRNKGVLDALRQNEPVLGLRDVEIFNEVQEYRDRADAARHVPGEPAR